MDDCPSSPSKSFIKQSDKPSEHMGSSSWNAVPGSSGPTSQPQLQVCKPRTSYFKGCFLTGSKKGHPFSGYSSRKAALISWHKPSAGDPSLLHPFPPPGNPKPSTTPPTLRSGRATRLAHSICRQHLSAVNIQGQRMPPPPTHGLCVQFPWPHSKSN